MPPLIFESAFHADWHTFKREIWQVLILSGPALLICIFLTGLFFYYVLDYQSEISLTAAFMFSSIISATDPVAVVAMLKVRVLILLSNWELRNDSLLLLKVSLISAMESLL